MLSLALTLTGPTSGGAAPVVPVYLAENRAGSVSLAHNLTTAGDSLVSGVNAPSGYSWPSQLLALLAGGSLTRVEQAAQTMTLTGLQPNPIPTQIAGQGAGPLANNSQLFDGGLNDYNTVTNTEPGIQQWQPGITSTSIPNIEASLTGAADQFWAYLANTAEWISGPGMVHWADWRKLYTSLQAVYGGHIFDIRRALMAKVTTSASDLDNINVYKWWDIPLSFRALAPASSSDPKLTFANLALTAWVTCSVTPNTEAAINSGFSAAAYAEGTLLQNINAAAVLGSSVYRKSANGTWILVDNKHLSRWGHAALASIALDILAAIQGDGAPVASPAALFCKQDAASGAAVGTIHYIGSAPSAMALFDSGGTLVTTLTLTDNGAANGVGSITVTRSATGTLTEGEQLLTLQMTDASGHVLHSAQDFRIGQPSTQTVPRLWLMPGTSTLPDSDFSISGRDAHALPDGDKFFFICWMQPTTLTGLTQYILNLGNGHGDASDLLIRITATGGLGFTAHNAANTLLNNTTVASAFSAATASWIAVDLDYSVAQPTVKGYYNKAGAGADVAINATGVAAVGPTTLALSKTIPKFLSLRDATVGNENFAAADSARSQFYGKIGNIIVGAGNIGIAGNPTLARTLWNLNNTPVARTPFATIGGLTPIWDIQGGIGDYLNGGFNPTVEPVFGTYRGIKGLT